MIRLFSARRAAGGHGTETAFSSTGAILMKFNLTQSKPFLMSVALATAMSGMTFAQSTQPANPQPANPPSAQQNSAMNSQYSKSEVRDAQQRLQKDGYYTGKIDGQDGPETQQAIKKFQQSEGLTASGRLDKQTCKKLGVTQK
jgi:peptidoglycan hydrolase-like protein with peptidoglycan-binding domain